jgi:hypothetical protein
MVMEPAARMVRVDDSAQTLESGGGGIRTLEEPKRPLAIFETELKAEICRDVTSSSPLNSPARGWSRTPGSPTSVLRLWTGVRSLPERPCLWWRRVHSPA